MPDTQTSPQGQLDGAGPQDPATQNASGGASLADEGSVPSADPSFLLSRELRRPFTPEAVKHKVQASWEGGALCVFYIDARLVIERLNLLCPALWFDRYEAVSKGLMWCHLTIGEITRSDVGSGYENKGLVSDAFKRAAVKFGVGVSLYALPKVILETKGDFIKQKKKQEGGKAKWDTRLTEKGEARCKEVYSAWLEETGKEKFGDPLDHGDVEGAVGDPEAIEAVTGDEAEDASAKGQSPDRIKELTQLIKDAGFTYKVISAALEDAGAKPLRASSQPALKESLVALTDEQAAAFEKAIS